MQKLSEKKAASAELYGWNAMKWYKHWIENPIWRRAGWDRSIRDLRFLELPSRFDPQPYCLQAELRNYAELAIGG
jgi:hypothetical protein